MERASRGVRSRWSRRLPQLFHDFVEDCLRQSHPGLRQSGQRLRDQMKHFQEIRLLGIQVIPDATVPAIDRAVVETASGQLVIQGANLAPATGKPRVMVDGATLTVVSYTSTQIVATFPSSLLSLGGGFLLSVTVSGSSKTFALTVSAPELALPFSGTTSSSGPAISATNTGNGYAIYGQGGTGVPGVGAYGGANTPSIGQGGAGIFGYGGISCLGSACNNGPGGSFLGGEDSDFDSLGGDGL